MEENGLSEVRKRDGRIVSFDQIKIAHAIWKAMQAVGIETIGIVKKALTFADAEFVSDKVFAELKRIYRSGSIPTIENIQDIVEENLIIGDYHKTAKAYIVYRHERAKIRSAKKEVPVEAKKLAEESSKYFQGPYEEFIYFGH